MNQSCYLQQFKEEELIFNKEETIIILKFIFKNKHILVDKLEISNKVKEFAQGLLFEAIDASYALGFVEAIFRSTNNPGTGMRKILKKFGKKSLSHWFKHATAKDLMQISIYEIVRQQLEFKFGRILAMYASGVAFNEINQAVFVAYSSNIYPTKVNSIIWG